MKFRIFQRSNICPQAFSHLHTWIYKITLYFTLRCVGYKTLDLPKSSPEGPSQFSRRTTPGVFECRLGTYYKQALYFHPRLACQQNFKCAHVFNSSTRWQATCWQVSNYLQRPFPHHSLPTLQHHNIRSVKLHCRANTLYHALLRLAPATNLVSRCPT